MRGFRKERGPDNGNRDRARNGEEFTCPYLNVWGPGLRKKAHVTENLGSTGRGQGYVGL